MVKNLDVYSAGAVLMENLLLERAARLLEEESKFYEGPYFKIEQRWNPQAITATDFVDEAVVQVACVAMLVENLVVSDQIIVPEEYSEGWQQLSQQLSQLVPDLIHPDSALNQTPERLQVVQQDFASLGISVDEIGAIEQGALFYDCVAAELGLPYAPSPYRADFLARATQGGSTNQSTAIRVIRDIDKFKRETLIPSLAERAGLPEFSVAFPSIFALVVKESKDKRDVIQSALRLRETRPAQDFRRWTVELDDAIKDGHLSNILKIQKIIQDELRKFASQLQISQTKQIKLQLSLTGVGVEGELAPADFLRKLWPKRGLARFIASLLNHWVEEYAIFHTVKKLFGLEIAPKKLERYIGYFFEGKEKYWNE